MSTPIYTFGYSGQDREALVQWLIANEGGLLDIRFSPYSKQPLWVGDALQERLGGQYVHVRAWGNPNYRGGPIMLKAPVVGLQVMQRLTERYKAIVLMCACKDFKSCHRKVVSEFLGMKGYQTQELVLAGSPRAEAERAQGSLF